MVKKWTTLFVILLTAFEFGCAVPRPNTDLCVVNAAKFHRSCFNMKTDFDENGNLKPDAKAKIKPARDIMDLDRNVCVDPDGFARLKAYIKKLREAAKCSAN